MSSSCTLKQQTKPYWLFLLLDLVLESDKNGSQNGMTALRTHLVSQSYGVKSTWDFTVPAGKTNQMLNEGSLVSEELSVVAIS